MSERHIQADVRNALAGRCKAFRANVGQAWTGDVERQPDGSILIRNPRPFQTGLPNGFSDLFGWTSELITPEMVGQRIARFLAIEMKDAKGRVSPEQAAFVAAVQRDGGRAGVARSVTEAETIAFG